MKTETVGDHLFWSYANLGMAHAAVNDRASSYGRVHYAVRNRLYTGLQNGSMDVRPIVEDDRLKMLLPQACCYCGSRENLAADHLISRKRGGADQGDNLVWACRPCNSSKGANDVLAWLIKRGAFPPLLLLRRYLKLAIAYSRDREILDLRPVQCDALPFDLSAIPRKFPPPDNLILWTTSLD